MKPIYLALLISLVPALASAQVTFHQAALDQLAGIAPPVDAEMVPIASPVVLPRVVHKKHVLPKIIAVVAKPATVAPSSPAAPATPAPAVQPVVAKPAVPPPVIKAPLGPVNVSFAAGSSDLPANAAASLKPLCDRAGADGLVGIDAYAPADSSDVSAAMRLSLSRALAVRDALTACGVPAAHIIPRADGAAAGHDPDTAMVGLGTGTAK